MGFRYVNEKEPAGVLIGRKERQRVLISREMAASRLKKSYILWMVWLSAAGLLLLFFLLWCGYLPEWSAEDHRSKVRAVLNKKMAARQPKKI